MSTFQLNQTAEEVNKAISGSLLTFVDPWGYTGNIAIYGDFYQSGSKVVFSDFLQSVNSGHIVDQINAVSGWSLTPSGHLDEYALHKTDSGNFLDKQDSGRINQWTETASGHLNEYGLHKSDSGNFLQDLVITNLTGPDGVQLESSVGGGKIWLLDVTAYIGSPDNANYADFMDSAIVFSTDSTNRLQIDDNTITASLPVEVPDEALTSDWDSSTETPTKNAVYDAFITTSGHLVLDEDDMASYSSGQAPSQQSVVEYIKEQTYKTVGLAWQSPTSDATVGTKKTYFVVPPSMSGMNLVFAHAEVANSGVAGVQTFDINKNGSSMLSGKLYIDSTELGSDTAATGVIIDTTNHTVVTHDVISVDVDSIHSSTAAQGELVTLEFRTP